MASQDRTLSFPLTNRKTRLFFEYDTGDAEITLMYDSGAQIPVWCTGAEVLLSAYPNAQNTAYFCTISGFGKEPEKGEVYKIPVFKLSNDTDEFIINDLFIVTLDKPSIGCDLLLSETMFSKTDFNIIRRQDRELKIFFDDIGRPYQCSAIRQGEGLEGITVWTQIG